MNSGASVKPTGEWPGCTTAPSSKRVRAASSIAIARVGVTATKTAVPIAGPELAMASLSYVRFGWLGARLISPTLLVGHLGQCLGQFLYSIF